MVELHNLNHYCCQGVVLAEVGPRRPTKSPQEKYWPIAIRLIPLESVESQLPHDVSFVRLA